MERIDQLVEPKDPGGFLSFLASTGEFTAMYEGSFRSEVWSRAQPSGKAPAWNILNRSVPLWRSELQMWASAGADSCLCWKNKDRRRPFLVVGPFSIYLRQASAWASLNVTICRCFDWQDCNPVTFLLLVPPVGRMSWISKGFLKPSHLGFSFWCSIVLDRKSLFLSK